MNTIRAALVQAGAPEAAVEAVAVDVGELAGPPAPP